jgi:hypothetical protein
MTRGQYNDKIQEMQRMGFESRVSARHSEKTGEIHQAIFEVYWDGAWHWLGYARPPFKEEAEFYWDEDKSIGLQARFAAALTE